MSSASSSSIPLKGPQGLKWLLYGAKGWIGELTLGIMNRERKSDSFVHGGRADSLAKVEEEIMKHKPDRILSFVGRTHGGGIYTIDYLEGKGKLRENVNDNLWSPMVLLRAAQKHNIHLTYLGTGCLFNYDEKHPLEGAIETGFKEDEEPNFFGSSYSTVKGFTDRLFHLFGNETALNCRIRMCLVPEFSTRNFITKITRYQRVCSIPNSMSFLYQLLPIMLDMAACKEVGTVNLVNPQTITHEHVLQRYRAVVDPEFEYKLFTAEEQRAILAADRSNNLLSTKRLETFAPFVLTSHQALEVVLKEMREYWDKFTDEEKTTHRKKI